MIKTIKRVVFSALSILGVSLLIWIVLMLNPNMVYSHSTTVDNVTVYHNLDLAEEAESLIKDAIKIASSSSIYDDQMHISLCINDHSFYPNLFPLAGGTAYAFFDKTVIYRSNPDFKNNVAEFTWEINNYETRKYDLTYLLAHEFMHNYQHNHNPKYQILSTLGSINWKLEGHADYIAREFKHDGQLIIKIKNYQIQEQKEHVGVPVFTLDNGTIQNLSYFKNALIIQYLMEEKQMDYNQICNLKTSKDELYSDMIACSEEKID